MPARRRALPRRRQLGMRDLHRAMGRAGVEPHVEDVGLLAERSGAPAAGTAQVLANEFRDRALEPHVRPMRARQRGGAIDHARIEPALFAALAIERRDTDAPRALARETPVGTQAHGVADAVARRRRFPAHPLVDHLERARAMLVVIDDHEPLLGGAEDHGPMTTPAVRVGVAERRGREQPTALTEPRDEVVVRLQHRAAHEGLRPGGEAPRLIDRARDLEAFPLADGEVLLAVAGRGVDQAGALVHADERRSIHHARIVPPRPLEHEADQLASGNASVHHRRARAQGLGDGIEPRCRHQQATPGGLGDHVLRRRIDHEPAIGRERPRRGGPCDGDDLGRALESSPRIISQREGHVDRRGRIVLVLDLRLGERGAIGGAPVDRAQAALDEAAPDQGSESLERGGLEAGIHREVGVRPLPPHPQALELLALDPDPALGERAASPADGEAVGLDALLAQLPRHLDLDRHAVVVPARQIRGIESEEREAAYDRVLPDLVRPGSHVDVVVRIRRTVVEQGHRTAAPLVPQARVQIARGPPGQALGFPLRQIGLHGELGARKVQRVSVPRHASSDGQTKSPRRNRSLGRRRSRYHPTSRRLAALASRSGRQAPLRPLRGLRPRLLRRHAGSGGCSGVIFGGRVGAGLSPSPARCRASSAYSSPSSRSRRDLRTWLDARSSRARESRATRGS